MTRFSAEQRTLLRLSRVGARMVGFLLLALLGACQPQVRSPDSATRTPLPVPVGVSVLEIAPSVYQPSAGQQRADSEASACRAWTLSAQQAEAFFKLSTPLPEGALNDFSWLPCTINGRLSAEGVEWTFQINAAGTSTWRAGGETLLLGCADRACEPFVILMPDSVSD